MLGSVPRKMVFGSDCPSVHPAVVLESIRRMEVSEDVRRGILSGNLENLLAGPLS